MGLLDAFKQYVKDAMPGGLLNPEVPKDAPKQLAGLLADFTPGIGDAKSVYDGVQSAREGDWLGAGMGALGALPFVPSFGGAIKQVKAKNGKLYEIVSTEFDAQDKKKYFIRPVSDGPRMKEGFLSVYKDSNGHHLNDVVIEKTWDRGNGLGSLLMEEALKNTDGKGLWGSTGFSGDGMNLANKYGLTKKDGKYWIPSVD